MDKDLIKEVIKEMILDGEISIDTVVTESSSWRGTHLVLNINGEPQDSLYGYELELVMNHKK